MVKAYRESIKVSLELVGAGDGFEMEPEAINGDENKTGNRQPDDSSTILEEAQSHQGSLTLVRGERSGTARLGR